MSLIIKKQTAHALHLEMADCVDIPSGDIYRIKSLDAGIDALAVVVNRKIQMAQGPLKQLIGQDGAQVQDWASKNNCEIIKMFTEL